MSMVTGILTSPGKKAARVLELAEPMLGLTACAISRIIALALTVVRGRRMPESEYAKVHDRVERLCW